MCLHSAGVSERTEVLLWIVSHLGTSVTVSLSLSLSVREGEGRTDRTPDSLMAGAHITEAFLCVHPLSRQPSTPSHQNRNISLGTTLRIAGKSIPVECWDIAVQILAKILPSANQTLFGGEKFSWVKTISCGGTHRTGC